MPDGARREHEILEPRTGEIEPTDDQHHQDDDPEQPAPDKAIKGQAEDVERHVAVEDRVLDVEWLLIEEGQDRLPLAGGDVAKQQAKENDDQHREDGGGSRREALSDPDRGEAAAAIESDQHVGGANRPEGDRKNEEGPELRRKADAEHAAVTERAEPEPIGVERGERFEQEEQEQHRGDSQDPSDRPPGDAHGGKARFGRQASKRGLAVEEAARRHSSRHVGNPHKPLWIYPWANAARPG